MGVTTIASGNKKTEFESKFFVEWMRDSLFAPYMGESENDIIQIKKELTKKKGNTISLPLIGTMQNSGVTGDNTLEGNEEPISNWNHDIEIDQVRNAFVVGKMEARSTEIDVMKAGKVAAKMWIMDDFRDDILQAFGSPNVDGVTAYASCTEAQKDAWAAAQNVSTSDSRILYGSVQSNSSGDHSADLAKLDTTADKLDFDIVQLAKRMAKKKRGTRASGGTRNIRPVKVKGQREWFVGFCESFAYRDLKTDTETLHQYAGVRGKDNPLFQDGDLVLDGCIIREVPEIASLEDVGDSGTVDVGRLYLSGAQTIGVAWGQLSQFVTKKDIDWDNQMGVAVSEVRGVEKLSFNDIQNGLTTVYVAANPDS